MGRARAWAELLRVSALFTVPGDALAGAATAGARPGRGTALAIGSSLCLYEAGMALNDWADREEDAVERPHRPIPSGRVAPCAALGAAGALTAAGLALAALAGRRTLAVSAAVAATVWAYDLKLKHTVAGPVAMGAARSLDVLLGASAAPGGRAGAALPGALAVGAHTAAVTAVSRGETRGGARAAPLAALAATAALSAALVRAPSVPSTAPRGSAGPRPERTGPGAARGDDLPGLPSGVSWRWPVPGPLSGVPSVVFPPGLRSGVSRRWPAPGLPSGVPSYGDPPGPVPCGLAPDPVASLVSAGLVCAYLATAVRPMWHALLNPSPPLTQRAVGGGIRALIPLQSALAARAGDPPTALALAGLVPVARHLARKVSPT
ncbi:SCO3242 family prenyltransferase [Streptomyces sp. 8L]|uniref:SCO3242 family prenyltransferase n=1 Tax=Streptomyces sp. 8L TaxID=2877242 RepID=UPI0021E555CB